MNNNRRKLLQSIINKLNDCCSELEMVKDEEQDAFDNLPEGFQVSERGEAMENAISEMENAISSIEDTITSIETAME
jgi:predicted  nucleic acid-binding Zn-ribbon protein